MDKPISKGDLVMVVRGHKCVIERAGGVPFRVTGFNQPTNGGWHCNKCDKVSAGGNEVAATGFGNPQNIPLSWLLKIDPTALPESVEHKESLTA